MIPCSLHFKGDSGCPYVACPYIGSHHMRVTLLLEHALRALTRQPVCASPHPIPSCGHRNRLGREECPPGRACTRRVVLQLLRSVADGAVAGHEAGMYRPEFATTAAEAVQLAAPLHPPTGFLFAQTPEFDSLSPTATYISADPKKARRVRTLPKQLNN